VAWLAIAPVKGMHLHEAEQLDLERHGAAGDRRFVLVDDRWHLVNGKRLGRMVQVHPAWDAASGVLTLRFPDGAELSEPVQLGEEREFFAYRGARAARELIGPWSAVLSAWAGSEVHLVQPSEPGNGLDRTGRGGVTLLSTASLDALARAAGADAVDRRRFRMTVGVAGIGPFSEEGWLGSSLRIGEAVVRVAGNVGRCAVTTQDPDSGSVDLPTLDLLHELRHDVPTTEPLPFGVWGEVAVPGRVRVGDPLELA
jgi:uncharacterized protein YcbX